MVHIKILFFSLSMSVYLFTVLTPLISASSHSSAIFMVERCSDFGTSSLLEMECVVLPLLLPLPPMTRVTVLNHTRGVNYMYTVSVRFVTFTKGETSLGQEPLSQLSPVLGMGVRVLDTVSTQQEVLR